jgi:hypothetical protein
MLSRSELFASVEVSSMRLEVNLQQAEQFKTILEIDRGSTRSHPVENWSWKSLRTCRKTD